MVQIVSPHGEPISRLEQHDLGLDFLDLEQLSPDNYLQADSNPEYILERLQEQTAEDYDTYIGHTSDETKASYMARILKA